MDSEISIVGNLAANVYIMWCHFAFPWLHSFCLFCEMLVHFFCLFFSICQREVILVGSILGHSLCMEGDETWYIDIQWILESSKCYWEHRRKNIGIPVARKSRKDIYRWTLGSGLKVHRSLCFTLISAKEHSLHRRFKNSKMGKPTFVFGHPLLAWWARQ